MRSDLTHKLRRDSALCLVRGHGGRCAGNWRVGCLLGAGCCENGLVEHLATYRLVGLRYANFAVLRLTLPMPLSARWRTQKTIGRTESNNRYCGRLRDSRCTSAASPLRQAAIPRDRRTNIGRPTRFVSCSLAVRRREA